MREVAPHLPILRSLEIEDCDHQSFIIFPLLKEIGKSTRQLERLKISFIKNISGFLNEQYPNPKVNFPSLRQLEITNWYGEMPPIKCPKLETLKIDDSETITGRDVWKVIKGSLRLSAINFHSFLFEQPFPTRAHLPQNAALRSLSMSWVDDDEEGTTCPKVCMLLMESSPNLVHLNLSIVTANHFRYLPPATMLPRLRHLGIEFILHREQFPQNQAMGWIRHVLYSATGVQDLRIIARDNRLDIGWIVGILISGSTNPNIPYPPCPRLSSFAVTGTAIDRGLMHQLWLQRGWTQ